MGFLENLFDKLKGCTSACAGRTCPFLVRFVNSSPRRYKCIKAVLGFPVGFALGYAFYVAIITRMKLPQFLAWGLAAFMMLFLAISYAISVQSRCVSVLTVPTFVTRTGRAYVSAYIVLALLRGPINNMRINASDITRSIACTTEIALNITEARLEIKLFPMANLARDMTDNVMNMPSNFKEFKQNFETVETEVEDEKETKKLMKDIDYVDELNKGKKGRRQTMKEKEKARFEAASMTPKERKYLEKVDFRCEDVFAAAVMICRKSLRRSYAACYTKLGGFLGTLLCWLMKLDFLCKLAKFIPNILGLDCDSKKVSDEGMGESYESGKSATEKLRNMFQKPYVMYKLEVYEQQRGIRTPADVKRMLDYEFARQGEWIKIAAALLHRVVALLFLKVMHEAFKYHQHYLTDIEYDNTYLTNYFRRIDARRHQRGKRSLMPLRRKEKAEVISPIKFGLTANETFTLIKASLKVVLQLMAIMLVFGFDRLVYEVLITVRKKGAFEMSIVGLNKMELTIQGSGPIAMLIRTLLLSFNRQSFVERTFFNDKCLPNPNRIPLDLLLEPLFIVAIILALVVVDSFVRRWRSFICAFFYPKRHKKRTLHLYNQMIQRRKQYLKFVRKDIRRQVEQELYTVNVSLASSIRQRLPDCLSSFLFRFGFGRRRCMVCQKLDDGGYIYCRTSSCHAVYCRHCWRDVRLSCLVCSTSEEWSDESADDFLYDD